MNRAVMVWMACISNRLQESIIDHGVQIQQANERKQSSKQGEELVAKKIKKSKNHMQRFSYGLP